MASNQLDGDMTVRGTLRIRRKLKTMMNVVRNRHVVGIIPIETARVQHRHVRFLTQGSTTNATDQRFPKHHAIARGRVAAFYISARTAAIGDSTCAAKLYKNGALVTGSTVTLTSAHAAMASVAATISDPNDAYAVGDLFEIEVDATAGTGTLAKGIMVTVIFDEYPK